MSTVQRFFATATVASMLMSAALPVGAATAAELQAQIDALMATLNALQGQVQTAQGSTPSAGAPAACSGISFSRSLTVGSSGTDVKCLQALLNQSADTQVAASGVGSAGSETTFFGSLTRAAVIKLQEKYASEVLTPIGLTAGTGFVGAKTRAKLSSMLTGGVAVTPTPAPTPGATPAPAPATGAFTVSAAADNPAATTLGVSSAYNTVLKVKVDAGASAVDVTSVTIERAGLSVDTHIAGVLVADEKGVRHGNVVTLADNKATIPFTADPVKIAAGGSATLSIQLHRSATGTSGTMQINLVGMSGTPAGLPVKGNLHTLADTAGVLGALTMDVVSQTTVTINVDIGQKDHILTKFRFAANANEDVKISRITLFQNGTAADDDLVNWDLVDPNGNVLATVAKATNKVVDFMLATPYVLAKGTNRDLTVRVDVVSGSSRTGQAIIQNDYDVVAVGSATGLGILPTAGTVDTSIPIGDLLTGVAGFNHLTVSAGTLTLAKAAGSPSGTFGIGAANVTLATWNLEAKGEDIQIQRADVNISGAVVAADLTGTVKLMTDAGQVLYSAASSTDALTDNDAAGADVVTLSTYYTIPAGTILKLKLVADASTTITDGDTAIGNISDIYFKRMTSNTFGTASGAAFVAGNTLTASIATLTVSNNAGLGNATVIEGGSDVLIGSYLLQTSSSEGVNVSSIRIDLLITDAAVPGTLSNLKLKRADTGAQIGSTVASPPATTATTSQNTITVSGQLNIPASTTTQVDVYVSMSTATADADTTADTIISSIAVGLVTGTGAVSGTTITGPSAVAGTATGRTITVVEGGTLTMSIDTSGAASSQFFTTGLAGVEMGRLRLAATVEDMKIQRLELRTVRGSGNITTVKLLGTGLSSDPSTNLTAGTAVFTFASGGEITVPAYGSRVVTAVVTTTPVSTLFAGQLGIVGFGTANAVGAGSGLIVQERLTGTLCTAAAGDTTPCAADTTFARGDLVYFTVTAADGTGAGVAANTAPNFYVVAIAPTSQDLTAAAGSIRLNGDPGDMTFAAGDLVTKLTATSNEVDADNDSENALVVGDVVFFFGDVAGTDNSASTGWHIVTTASAANAGTITLDGAAVVVDADDIIVRFANASLANAMAGNVMRYEEVEPVITLASGSPSGAQSPSSSQNVVLLNVKAEGSRAMTFNSVTLQKGGSNEPYRYVTDLSLWNGTNQLAEVATTTIAGALNGDTLTPAVVTAGLEFCTGTGGAVVDEVGGITVNEYATLAVGDVVVFSDGTDEITATIATKGAIVSGNCGGSLDTGDNVTFSNVSQTKGTANPSATPNIHNYMVHFDALVTNETLATGDVTLAEQTITEGATMTLTVKANTSLVRTGVASGTVTFGITLPGTAGPLQVVATQTEGFNWNYTPLGTGSAAYKTEGDSYPVSGSTLTY